MNLSNAGADLIANFEGFRARPYKDAVGVWTIGYGSTKGVGPGSRSISREDALARLRREVNETYGAAVNRLGLPLNQQQFDALASFVYNLGPGALASSTGIGRALRARQWRRAADEILEWDKAGGRRLAGLTARRRVERKLFLSGKPTDVLVADERYHVNLAAKRGLDLRRAERTYIWLSGRANRVKARARVKGGGGWGNNRAARFQALQKSRAALKKRIDAARRKR